VTFGWFLAELERVRGSGRTFGIPEEARVDHQVSNRVFIVFGYAVLFWSTVRFVPISLVTPDLLLTSILFGVAAICVRIVRQPQNTFWYVALGGWLAAAIWPRARCSRLVYVFW